MIYLDAGTTYSKIIAIDETFDSQYLISSNSNKSYYIIPSSLIKKQNIEIKRACGHMSNANENEIIALANGCKNYIDSNATVLDLGSRDAKWIRFKNNKFHDMDWNTSCASSTGATVEMLRLEQVLEVGCIVGLTSLVAVGLSFPASGWFVGLGIIQEPVSMESDGWLCAVTVCGALLVGMVAGLYPAYFVTSFPTALLLKGNYGLTPSGRRIKSVLLVIQYAIACSLMVFIAFVYLQNRMMMHSSTKFDQDQLAIVELTSEMAGKQSSWLQETLRQYPEVEDVAFATEYVGGQDSYSTWGMKWKGEEAETYRIWCSPNFFDVMGIRIIEGRNFTGDTDSGYIINAFLLALFVGDFLWNTYAAQAVAVAIIVVVNYLLFKYFAFHHRPKSLLERIYNLWD